MTISRFLHHALVPAVSGLLEVVGAVGGFDELLGTFPGLGAVIPPVAGLVEVVAVVGAFVAAFVEVVAAFL